MVSSRPYAEMKMTGRSASSGMLSINSMPSASGKIRSSRTKWGFSFLTMRDNSRWSPVTSGE